MLPEVIIFDLDDTIISLKSTANETWKIMCDEYVSIYSNVDSKSLYEMITDIRLSYWNDEKTNKRGRKNQNQARREIIHKVFKKLNLPSEHVVTFADTYSKKRLTALKLFPMAEETLEILKNQGVRLALVTNGELEVQRYKIDKFDLEKYFEIILIEGEVGFGKPDIRIYEKVLKEMNVTPDVAWFIGDNLIWDVQAPQKLGIYSIWNDFEERGLPTNTEVVPDYIIKKIYSIIEEKLILIDS